MKEEDLIRKKCGSRDPFRVPEGYFESFTAHLMDKLPEQPTASLSVSRTRHLLRFAWSAAAAVVCGFIISGIFHFSQDLSSNETSAYTADIYSDINQDNDIDEYLDYAMMSNQEIAQYLTEAY